MLLRMLLSQPHMATVTVVSRGVAACFAEEACSHRQSIHPSFKSCMSPAPLCPAGTPCNQFGGQEPGDNDELLNGLAYVRPGNGFVPAFPLTQKMDVNGAFANPLWTGEGARG